MLPSFLPPVFALHHQHQDHNHLQMMASNLHPFPPVVAVLLLFCFFSSNSTSSTVIAKEFTLATAPSYSETVPSSSSPISAPPSYFPTTRPKFPAEPPVLTPDISPLLPSPGRRGDNDGGHGLVGSVPTIPSSPSPPNPDIIGPDSASTRRGPSTATANVSTANASPVRLGEGFVLGVVMNMIVSWLLLWIVMEWCQC